MPQGVFFKKVELRQITLRFSVRRSKASLIWLKSWRTSRELRDQWFTVRCHGIVTLVYLWVWPLPSRIVGLLKVYYGFPAIENVLINNGKGQCYWEGATSNAYFCWRKKPMGEALPFRRRGSSNCFSLHPCASRSLLQISLASDTQQMSLGMNRISQISTFLFNKSAAIQRHFT